MYPRRYSLLSSLLNLCRRQYIVAKAVRKKRKVKKVGLMKPTDLRYVGRSKLVYFLRTWSKMIFLVRHLLRRRHCHPRPQQLRHLGRSVGDRSLQWLLLSLLHFSQLKVYNDDFTNECYSTKSSPKNEN